ncbi:retrotransposon protein, putative, ty1-copia subclass [Tanacetum coccineum]
MISKEDSKSKIDLEEIQESVDEEPIVNTNTQQEVDKISDSTLSELDEPGNYKEAMASPKAAKWNKAMKSEIQSMLVANGYTQTHEIDYEETFSPVAKIKSIKIMLAIDAFDDYEICLLRSSNGSYLDEEYSLESLEKFPRQNKTPLKYFVIMQLQSPD